ncbi:MAG: hypothetical protein PHR66_15060 [Desulfuromonadaceae bacterium]|nr:hypothetical protein [Desulfuromonadaceae bacterium]
MNIRKYLGNKKRQFFFILRVNWTKTIWLNFKYFKPTLAIQLPIICYGKIKAFSLKGRINISGIIKPGLIQIGKDIDNMPISALPVRLRVDGSLNFTGPCIISGGTNIAVGSDANITIGKFSRICSGVYLKAIKSITIGDFTWITAESIVMDSDIHYVKNINTGIIKKNTAPITIGNYCWIVMRSVISKGAVLPDYSIVARNSYVNKDYSVGGKIGLFLAGSPAREIVAPVQYIPYLEKEGILNNYFKHKPEANEYTDTKTFEEYSNCTHNDFKLY